MLGSVRSSSVCTSQRRWLHRFDNSTEDLPPTTVPETFDEALSGVGRCSQTGSVGAGISLNMPILDDVIWLEDSLPTILEALLYHDSLSIYE